MSSKIKKFFSKKKEEAKFKLNLGGGLGQGRSLNSEGPSTSSAERRQNKDVYVPLKRDGMSHEAKAAAAAALARVQKKDSKEFNTSLAAIKAQAKRELEAEQKLKEDLEKTKLEDKPESSNKKDYSCNGVFFRCPLVSEEVLPSKEWKVKIKEFLYQQLESELGLTACLIIYNCNTKDKVEGCVETLTKYIENIINHPDEEKYLKIRMSNRIFSDKVRYVEGSMEFLKAAGFIEQDLDNETFLIWSSDNIENGLDLPTLLDCLKNAEPLQLELDRNIQVLMPSQARRVQLPPDFFRLTPEELKREQKMKTEALEQAQVLKTKAMREREEQRILNSYKYALIRVKFPDGIYLQGTFHVHEKLVDIYEFVQSCLQDESSEFNLIPIGGAKLQEEDLQKSLYDLRLIPTVVFLYHKNTELQGEAHYIKEELLLLIQNM